MGDDFKIRTLPRGNERVSDKKEGADSRQKASPPWRRAPQLVLAAVLLSLGVWFFLSSESALTPAHRGPTEQKVKMQTEADERVARHLREMALKREMERRSLEIENDNLTNPAGERPQPEVWDPPPGRVYGLQLDQEDRAGKIYQDINSGASQESEMSPEDRINARLANAKWIAEMERAEQRQFVANFIRQAAENGYEITLNDQLVVVKVKKIPGPEKVPIDKILDQLNRQPSSSP